MTYRYAVIGNPIAHSKSAIVHMDYARQTDQHISYVGMEGRADNFAGTVEHFFSEAGLGLNVTVPFKLLALELAVRSTE